MHNLRAVVSFEFLRTIKKKEFWMTTLAFPLLIVMVLAISVASNKSAEDTTKKLSEAKFSISVLDESKLINQATLKAIDARTYLSKQAGIAAVKSGAVDAFFYYPADLKHQPIEIYGDDVGLTKNGRYSTVAKEVLESSVASELKSPDSVGIIKGESQSKLTTYENGKQAKGFEKVIAPGVFLILFYIIIVLLGNQMLASTTEEKENRVIEMILTTVSSRSLIFGKIIALMLLGAIQLLAILLPTIIGYLAFRDNLSIPNLDLSKLVFDPVNMAVGAALFASSLLLFTGLLVAIGAAMPNAKEATRFFSFAMFILFVPLYAASAIVTDPAQPIVKIFSFLPLFAPITLMLRNAIDNLSNVEAATGVVVVLVSGCLALLIAVRSFRSGTLQYGRKLTLKEMLGIN